MNTRAKSLPSGSRAGRLLAGACAITLTVALGTVVPSPRATAGAPTQPLKWTKVSVQLPFGDTDFPAGEGSQAAEGYCLMCHSAGTVLRQPPLTEAQWQAEIQKMRASFGAPVPVEQDATLVRYLLGINNPAAKQP